MRFRKRVFILVTSLLNIVIFAVSCFCGETPVHFADFDPTPTSCKYAGRVDMEDIDAVDGEDEVGVFVREDSGREILVGACVMGQDVASHYFVYVYLDDPTTEDKDGADHGEELAFRFWDKSEDREYRVPPAYPYMIYETGGEGLAETSVPPIWKNGKIDALGLLILVPPTAPGDIDGSGNIDLRDIVLALQSLTQIVSDPVYSDADLSGDSRIGMEDVLHVLQHVAEME